MMTSYVWHCFCIYRTKNRPYRCLLHFSIIMSHSTLSGTTVWKQDQKYKTKATRPSKTKSEAGLRPVLKPRLRLQD